MTTMAYLEHTNIRKCVIVDYIIQLLSIFIVYKNIFLND